MSLILIPTLKEEEPMKKRTWCKFAVVFIAMFTITICLSVAAFSADKKMYKWRAQSQYSTTSNSWGDAMRLKQAIEFNTNGQIQIELYPAGQLAKPKETFEAVAQGLIEMEIGCLVYESGKVDVADTNWLPFAWESASHIAFMYEHAGILELMRTALKPHNMYYLCPLTCGAYGFMTKFPINTLADLRGKKIHSTGMASKAVQAAGAQGVPLSAPEIYTALQRGTIDGTCWPLYTIDSYKFYEVTKYITKPQIYSPSLWDVMINMDRWNELSDDLKAKVNRAGVEVMAYSTMITNMADMAVEKAAMKYGMTISTLPDEEAKKMKDLIMPLWDVTAKKSKINAEIVNIFRTFEPDPTPVKYN